MCVCLQINSLHRQNFMKMINKVYVYRGSLKSPRPHFRCVWSVMCQNIFRMCFFFLVWVCFTATYRCVGIDWPTQVICLNGLNVRCRNYIIMWMTSGEWEKISVQRFLLSWSKHSLTLLLCFSVTREEPHSQAYENIIKNNINMPDFCLSDF